MTPFKITTAAFLGLTVFSLAALENQGGRVFAIVALGGLCGMFGSDLVRRIRSYKAAVFLSRSQR